jgi:hypothetical protein
LPASLSRRRRPRTDVSDSSVLPLVFGDEGMGELARCIEDIDADVTAWPSES